MKVTAHGSSDRETKLRTKARPSDLPVYRQQRKPQSVAFATEAVEESASSGGISGTRVYGSRLHGHVKVAFAGKKVVIWFNRTN